MTKVLGIPDNNFDINSGPKLTRDAMRRLLDMLDKDKSLRVKFLKLSSAIYTNLLTLNRQELLVKFSLYEAMYNDYLTAVPPDPSISFPSDNRLNESRLDLNNLTLKILAMIMALVFLSGCGNESRAAMSHSLTLQAATYAAQPVAAGITPTQTATPIPIDQVTTPTIIPATPTMVATEDFRQMQMRNVVVNSIVVGANANVSLAIAFPQVELPPGIPDLVRLVNVSLGISYTDTLSVLRIVALILNSDNKLIGIIKNDGAASRQIPNNSLVRIGNSLGYASDITISVSEIAADGGSFLLEIINNITYKKETFQVYLGPMGYTGQVFYVLQD